jgi:DNA-binding transcriptional MerR regulator
VDEVQHSDLTIDELAQRTGMTVRNIRAHQSRGLLPPPEVRGRTGYYGTEHLARVELIKELQADGFHLDAIRRLLEGAGGSTTEVLRFTRAVHAAFEEEEPRIVELTELADQWGPDATVKLVEQATKLGLYRPLGDGRFEETSPRLGNAGAELARLGVPADRALSIAAKVSRHARGVSRLYVELFVEVIWEPFERDGRPAERWPEVLEGLERLRPLAAESLLAFFQMTMTEQVESTLGRELERFGKKR